jgi:putative lipoprotein
MRLGCLLGAALLAACAGNRSGTVSAPAVSGHVTYRERMALPPDAELRVQILDVSRMDAAATSVADTTIRPEGRQVPLPFMVRYDPKRLAPRHDSAIRATITSGGQLTYTTPTVVKVITRDHPTMVNLVLSQVQAPGSPAQDQLSGAWLLEDIGGTGVIDNAQATLEFPEPGRAAGRGSCNQFSGSVTVTGSALAFGPLASTQMACAPAVMDQESRYLKALQAAERYALEGAYLLIYAKGVEKPLRFTRATGR